ncbi:DmsC/YnfH family molybdoenzyme membrane anchor subunit [Hasllibacter sp. MH4015]|uniref:dimethyl sulfoxide reductase anchor subunit family protein n=1 Tax=Hasllibacter sp. MH4015 TaxID=2854029 RepID=UPI001CD1DDB7|nr:DmsC/YnfH family molybdoenzyme membrane anchor subunit [Hasllibacter sp. MH4015]
MHPAPSVIIFTTLSGLGFGLLTFLGLGLPEVSGWVAFWFFLIGYVLAVGGLISSTFHLGHPERALKAFTQWKTSWLSREGICAVAALLTMALYGAGLVFFNAAWQPLGYLGALLSLATVFTTSMIYTQMKTVPRWHTPLTPVKFLALSLAGGALLAGQAFAAIFLLLIAAAITIATWIIGDGAFEKSGTDMETATGLGAIGRVKAFEPPHTGTNYLLREFVHVVGRKHAMNLRILAFVFAFIIPILLMVALVNHVTAAIAILSHLIGVAIARWLFFAEAEHVVGLYYGKR